MTSLTLITAYEMKIIFPLHVSLKTICIFINVSKPVVH